MPTLRNIVFALLAVAATAGAQEPARIRAAYTSIAIQMTPLYLMKELDLGKKQGLNLDMLYVPVSSRAVQAALAGEIHFLTSGGVANINANMSGADFVGLTSTLNTFTFKIVSRPDLPVSGQRDATSIIRSMARIKATSSPSGTRRPLTPSSTSSGMPLW